MLYDKVKAQNLRSNFKNRRERKLNTTSGLFHLLQSLHNVLFVQQCCLIFGITHSDTGFYNFAPFFCRVCRFNFYHTKPFQIDFLYKIKKHNHNKTTSENSCSQFPPFTLIVDQLHKRWQILHDFLCLG